MTSLLFTLAIVAAVAAVGYRRLRRSRERAAAARAPGASAANAIAIRSFDDMDSVLARLDCVACRGFLDRTGEGSRSVGDRRYRIARLRCLECDEEREVFFDTTDLLQ